MVLTQSLFLLEQEKVAMFSTETKNNFSGTYQAFSE